MDHSYSVSIGDVQLRPLAHGDIESLRLWRNDVKNSRYIRKIDSISPEAQEAWFASYLEDPDTLTFAIEASGELAGSVALYEINDIQAEFGRLMVGERKGSGIGGKATYGILKIAFEDLGLSEVLAEVSVDNTPAIVIYTKLGFRVTGRSYNELAQMDEFSLVIDRDRFESLSRSVY